MKTRAPSPCFLSVKPGFSFCFLNFLRHIWVTRHNRAGKRGTADQIQPMAACAKEASRTQPGRQVHPAPPAAGVLSSRVNGRTRADRSRPACSPRPLYFIHHLDTRGVRWCLLRRPFLPPSPARVPFCCESLVSTQPIGRSRCLSISPH